MTISTSSGVHVKDYADVVRCYKCQSYGHVAKYCKDKLCCGFCAGEHDRRQCSADQSLPEVCRACKRFGKPANHSVTFKECPAYLRAVEESIRRTEYKVNDD